MDSGVGKLSDFDNIQIRTPSLPCHLTVVLWIENMLWMYVIVKLCQCDWSVIVWLIGVSVVLMICDNVTVIISCDMISFRHNFTIIIRISFVNWRLQLLLTILIFLPPTMEMVNAISRDVCLSICLLVRLLQNACMQCIDFDDILCVDTRELSGHGRTDQLLSPIRIIVGMPETDCFLP